ncbi:MAG TPA: choice-of-anchor tandem repeat GloVer-containing protein [Rhizomicrobium sp.]
MVALLLPAAADAAIFKLLHAFNPKLYGRIPQGVVIEDENGNLYGTTSHKEVIDGHWQYGTIYKLAPDRSISLLYTFRGGNDGAYPFGSLVRDSDGNLYGVTLQGGAGNGPQGFGTVFKLAPDGTETVLYVFKGISGGDGASPNSLILSNGSLYGTTASGGINCFSGCGTVFKLAPDGTETILYAFRGGIDGNGPDTAPIVDEAGNIYGATFQGGGTGCGGPGCGILFKIAPRGRETVLHVFAGKRHDGANPTSLIADQAGNFYGTTAYGGAARKYGNGWGTIFELSADGTETILHDFRNDEGPFPNGLILDGAGNLYGTTYQGGDGSCGFSDGCGTVFKFAQGTLSQLHRFVGNGDGARPNGIIEDAAGNLLGTTQFGGNVNLDRLGYGAVFELTP